MAKYGDLRVEHLVDACSHVAQQARVQAARECAEIALEEVKRWEDSNQYGRAQRSSTATDIYMKILRRFDLKPEASNA